MATGRQFLLRFFDWYQTNIEAKQKKVADRKGKVFEKYDGSRSYWPLKFDNSFFVIVILVYDDKNNDNYISNK